MSYIDRVKPFDWNSDKNARLRQERMIGFTEIVAAIESGNLLDDIRHPSAKYPHQKIFVVEIDSYAYAVPYVEDNEKIFLKTIIPSRKATKKYLKGEA
ncbi:MAG: hypothetical protein WBB39_03815 [Candidatus Saccharimonadales bacterium]